MVKSRIQIQHLLKLNLMVAVLGGVCLLNSNTTLVKVKLLIFLFCSHIIENSNTTLVKVKLLQ